MGGLVRRVNDRRVVWTGVVLVVLGVITSVVVAMAVAVLGKPHLVNPAPTVRIASKSDDGGLSWEGRRDAALGRVQWELWPQKSPPGAVRLNLAQSAQDAPTARPPRWASPPKYAAFIVHHGYGLPAPCLMASDDWETDHLDTFVIIEGWSASSGEIWLPATPIWSGLAVNTAFWAAAWWLLLGAPRQLRRWRRARRGECVRCGYDLRGVAGVCPECGWDGGARRTAVADRGAA